MRRWLKIIGIRFYPAWIWIFEHIGSIQLIATIDKLCIPHLLFGLLTAKLIISISFPPHDMILFDGMSGVSTFSSRVSATYRDRSMYEVCSFVADFN